MRRGFERKDRVADLIQKSLATLLQRGIQGENLGFVTITRVSVSRDLSYAKIYTSVLSDAEENIKRSINILNKAVPALRYELAKMVKLRIVPDFKFIYDESTAHSFKISTLINEGMKKKSEGE